MNSKIDMGRTLFHLKHSCLGIISTCDLYEAGEWDGEQENKLLGNLVMVEVCFKAIRDSYSEMTKK